MFGLSFQFLLLNSSHVATCIYVIYNIYMCNFKTFIKSLLNPHITVYSKATAAYNGQDNTHFSELFATAVLIDETQPSV